MSCWEKCFHTNIFPNRWYYISKSLSPGEKLSMKESYMHCPWALECSELILCELICVLPARQPLFKYFEGAITAHWVSCNSALKIDWLTQGGRYHSLSSIHTMAYYAVENGHLRRVQMDCVKRSGIETNLTCCVFLMCNLEDYPNAFYAVNYAGLNEPLVTGKIFLLFKRPSLTCITPCYNALYLLLLKCSMD